MTIWVKSKFPVERRLSGSNASHVGVKDAPSVIRSGPPSPFPLKLRVQTTSLAVLLLELLGDFNLAVKLVVVACHRQPAVERDLGRLPGRSRSFHAVVASATFPQ